MNKLVSIGIIATTLFYGVIINIFVWAIKLVTEKGEWEELMKEVEKSPDELRKHPNGLCDRWFIAAMDSIDNLYQ